MGRVVTKIFGICRQGNRAALCLLLTLCLAFAALPARAAAAQGEAPLPPPAPVLARILFTEGDATVSKKAEEQITAFAHDFLSKSGRLMITAYAGPPRGQSLDARRISLKRARKVRGILIREGVVKERILVRALGGVEDSGPTERVDIGYAGR